MNENQRQAIAKLGSLKNEILGVIDAISLRQETAWGALRFGLSLLDKNRATPHAITTEYHGYRQDLDSSAFWIKNQNIPQAIERLTSLKGRFDEAAKSRSKTHYGWLGRIGKEIKSREKFPGYAQKVADILKLL